MMPAALPTLPAPFEGVALSEAASGRDADLDGNLVSLESILWPEPMAQALEGLLRRWGPGDRRAAASLWTQGYFGRLLRPVVAYGLVHDIWFSLAPADVRVALSVTATPVRFVLKRVAPASVSTHLHRIVEDNVRPLISRLARMTGTSERVHWSNASFSFCRAHAHVRALWPDGGIPADVAARLRELEALTAAAHPLCRPTLTVSDGAGAACLRRKVCCIRYKLDGLKKCGTACPIDAPLSSLP
ncbi:siderophore-iron reductase FhuF [Ensifer sp. MJa1]|uniref:siderophore-iron reductase FhuF n=1 Tax=Ensifer sp. MJa1 TaxID=2919888 RepID=UPI00300902A4